MNGMSDQFYSRLVSFARQNKDVKLIKNVVDNKVEVELNDGSSGWINWETLTSNEPHVKVIINETN